MLNKIKASLKSRFDKAYKIFIKQYGEDRECKVYDIPRSKQVAWRAFGRWMIVSIFYIASAFVPGTLGDLFLMPVLGMAFLGSISVTQQAAAFKVGWFAGNVDLATTIRKHDNHLSGAVEEQTLRMNFVLEGLGVGRREELWDNEDEE